ncbi:hypothetical protein ACPCHQ_17070 [Ralstonia thomasii]|uniref:Head decoration protein n=2 Tax=Ralstonia TaxID=48736 RepID=A0ABN9JC20_9RALS|nr:MULTISPECIES: hypothetical protein [Ralstonia]MBT2181012.1 hypothetical protein [Ralstonia pickettii]CAJ0710708.1 hypothetical protein LMG7143_01697 [Ralstonia sp. LMG 18095]CAJ0806243.1 hypothetical protein LMG18095_04408 [Ralstonia sp. LMG 18095]
MTVTAKPLIEGKLAENAQTTQYTATGVRTIIDKFTGNNSSGAPATLTINLVPSASAAGTSNQVVSKTLAAGETYTFPEVVGHVLAAGDFISTLAGTASAISIRSSGREIN